MKNITIRAFVITTLFSFGILVGNAGAAPRRARAQSVPRSQGAGQNNIAGQFKKIWTEDDLVSLRKPWDLYLDRAARVWQESIAAAVAAAAGVTEPSASVPISAPTTLTDNTPIPDTIEEIEAKIPAVQAEIAHLTSNIQDAQQSYEASKDDDQRARLKLNMEIAQEGLQDRNEDLNRLQARLQELKGKQAGSSTAQKP